MTKVLCITKHIQTEIDEYGIKRNEPNNNRSDYYSQKNRNRILLNPIIL